MPLKEYQNTVPESETLADLRLLCSSSRTFPLETEKKSGAGRERLTLRHFLLTVSALSRVSEGLFANSSLHSRPFKAFLRVQGTWALFHKRPLSKLK